MVVSKNENVDEKKGLLKKCLKESQICMYSIMERILLAEVGMSESPTGIIILPRTSK